MQSVTKKLAGISMLVVAFLLMFAILFGRHMEIAEIIANKGSYNGYFVDPTFFNFRLYTYIFMIAIGGVMLLLPFHFEPKRSDFDTSTAMSPSAVFAITIVVAAVAVLTSNLFSFTPGHLYLAFSTVAALIGFKGISDANKKQERGGALSMVAVTIGLAPYATILFFRIITGEWIVIF